MSLGKCVCLYMYVSVCVCVCLVCMCVRERQNDIYRGRENVIVSKREREKLILVCKLK